MNTPTLLLSTCGTSLLTNALRQHKIADFHGGHLNALSNQPSLEAMEPSRQTQLTELLELVKHKLQDYSTADAARASAELNGINRVDDGLSQHTLHYILATDTYVGRQTAALVQRWLQGQEQQVSVFPITGLTTNTSAEFMAGAKNLLAFLDGTIAPFAGSHRIVFNLTGGFKSLLGLMTTFGTFYADETVYVFESGDDLIRIPRLPVKLDNGLIADHAAALLRMEAGDYLTSPEIGKLPPALLEAVEDRYGLSVWGELIWKRHQEPILKNKLLPLPHLQYTDTFQRDFSNLQLLDRLQLQKTLARASMLLAESNGSREALLGHRAGGIKYEQFSGNNSRYGHFRFGRGLRVSCEPVSGKLILRHCGQHDYVEYNP